MFFIFLALFLSSISCKTLWVKPDGALGDGSGSSKQNAHGNLNTVQELLNPGDTLKFVDGTYNEPFTVRKSGSAGNYIVYSAESVGGVTFDMRQQKSSAIIILNKEWIHIDGFRAGDTTSWGYHMLNNNDMKVTRCGCWNGGSTPEKCNANNQECDHNSHCFEFAFSQRVLGEDLWVWGAFRYGAVLYQTSDSTLRRVACNGGPWGSLPHACLTSYCNQRSNIENAVVTGIRLGKNMKSSSNFRYVHGGFVSDAHDCGPYTPAHNNVMHGVIAIDNGTPRTERPDSSPYQFLVMSQNGWDVFEDVVAITGPSNDQGSFFVTLTEKSGQAMSYWNGPTSFFQKAGKYNVCTGEGAKNCPAKSQTINTGNVRIQKRWIDKKYTNEPLWPWPLEDIIERDLKLGKTITQFVQDALGSDITLEISSSPTSPASTPVPKQTPKQTPSLTPVPKQTPSLTPVPKQTPTPVPKQTPSPGPTQSSSTPIAGSTAQSPSPSPTTTVTNAATTVTKLYMGIYETTVESDDVCATLAPGSFGCKCFAGQCKDETLDCVDIEGEKRCVRAIEPVVEPSASVASVIVVAPALFMCAAAATII